MITRTPSDLGDHAPQGLPLLTMVFTPDNWSVPQRITFVAESADDHDDHLIYPTHTAHSGSDRSFAGTPNHPAFDQRTPTQPRGETGRSVGQRQLILSARDRPRYRPWPSTCVRSTCRLPGDLAPSIAPGSTPGLAEQINYCTLL